MRPVAFSLAVVGRAGSKVMVLAVAALMLVGCGAWHGIANVPLPGGPGTGSRHLTIFVQMPDTLALNVNSRVRVADVFVGTVRAITFQNWVATLELDLQPEVRLPANATAMIGQTSLLGSQHVELAAPPHPARQPLRSGDTIPLANSSAFPTTERTLASIATVLSGGGIPNLEVVQNEAYAILNGRGDQIREFLTRLDTFTAALNAQRDDLTRAINSSDRLLTIVANRSATLDQVLTEFPALIKHFANTRDTFIKAVEALGQFSSNADNVLTNARTNFDQNLARLARPLTELGRAAPYLLGALKLSFTPPFDIDAVPKLVRGDYINASLTLDLTLSALDNGLLTGTGVSGMLRALEQSWGRDPNTMIPDVRFTPNPHDAPGGPLVERAG